MLKNLPKPLFSFKGKVSRLEYFVTYLIVTGGGISYILLVDALYSKEALTSGIGHKIFLVGFLLLIPFSLSLTVRRLRDAGMSMWWIATLPIPLIGLFTHLCLFLKKSDNSQNFQSNVMMGNL